jgi:GNAT superfamily N-acetyltransferase
LDQITLTHGPHDLLRRFVQRADEMAWERGIQLRLRTDFERLAEINERNRDSWPPLIPMFDPRHCSLRIDSAFWIDAYNERGETVATHGNRLYHWPRTRIEEEFTSLRAFYDDPAPHRAAGESVEVQSISNRVITGTSICAGAVWVHPAYRGAGLATIVPRVSRAYAQTRWNPETIWILVEPKTLAGGLPRASGPFEVDMKMMLRLSHRGDLPALLMSTDADALFADLTALVDQATLDKPRRSEIARTNASLERRQGRRSRS